MSIRTAIALKDQERHRDGMNQPSMNVDMPIYRGDQRTPLPVERVIHPGRIVPQVMPQVIDTDMRYRGRPVNPQVMPIGDMRYRQKNPGQMFFKHHLEKNRNMLPG